MLSTGASVAVTVSLAPTALLLNTGVYSGSIYFSNVNSGSAQSRAFVLRVAQPDYFTELFRNNLDLQDVAFTFTPDGSASFYRICRENVTNFFTDPAGGAVLVLDDDSFSTESIIGFHVSLYGRSTNEVHVGSNGFITFDEGDEDYTESTFDHFALPRVSGLFRDLNPEQGGEVRWQQLSNRVAATWLRLTEYGRNNTNSFQIEMFFDGRIRITYLQMDADSGLAGVSRGDGLPFGFDDSDFSAYTVCYRTLEIERAGTNVVLSWNSEPGRTYRVQSKTTMDAPWTTDSLDVLATGLLTSVTNNPPPVQKFYRVLVLP